MADGIKARIGAVWKDLTPSIKVASAWKTPDAVHIRVGGIWKQVWTALVTPTVSPRADGDSNLNSDFAPTTCHQGCDFDADGNEYENTPNGAQTNVTVWKDSGDAAGAWVEFVRTGGTQSNWSGHTSGVRYNLGTNQRFSMSVTAANPGDSNYKDIIGYFRMWDAASGGNILWTGPTVTWSCRATYQTGPCSLC